MQEMTHSELVSQKDDEIRELKGRIIYLEDKFDSLMLSSTIDALGSEETMTH